MFDYHMHSIVSFDGHNTGLELAQAARDRGLKEICFTDHVDFVPQAAVQTMVFDVKRYSQEYDDLEVPGLKIRRGMEFGLTDGNQSLLLQRLSQRHGVCGIIDRDNRHNADQRKLLHDIHGKFPPLCVWVTIYAIYRENLQMAAVRV